MYSAVEATWVVSGARTLLLEDEVLASVQGVLDAAPLQGIRALPLSVLSLTSIRQTIGVAVDEPILGQVSRGKPRMRRQLLSP